MNRAGPIFTIVNIGPTIYDISSETGEGTGK